MHTTSAFAKWGTAFNDFTTGTGSIDELTEHHHHFENTPEKSIADIAYFSALHFTISHKQHFIGKRCLFI
jgi:hypothetical protein